MNRCFVLCLALALFISPRASAQSSPPSMPNRTNLSQAERNLTAAKRTLQEHSKLKGKETRSNVVNVRLDWDEKSVRDAENRVAGEQRTYDAAMENYNRKLQAYQIARAKAPNKNLIAK